MEKTILAKTKVMKCEKNINIEAIDSIHVIYIVSRELFHRYMYLIRKGKIC